MMPMLCKEAVQKWQTAAGTDGYTLMHIGWLISFFMNGLLVCVLICANGYSCTEVESAGN